MTTEEILGYTSAQLALLTQSDLEKTFEAALNITRPDRAPKPVAKKAKTPSHMKEVKNETMDFLKQMGISTEGLE